MTLRRQKAMLVSIPQAVWIACNSRTSCGVGNSESVSIPQAVWIACNSTVLTVFLRFSLVSIPQAVWIACNEYHHSFYLRKQVFQYRKRYGLHAILTKYAREISPFGFNTASGMDCMQCRTVCLPTLGGKFQYRKRHGLHAIVPSSEFDEEVGMFQYRKRYGLHAIFQPSTTTKAL